MLIFARVNRILENDPSTYEDRAVVYLNITDPRTADAPPKMERISVLRLYITISQSE